MFYKALTAVGLTAILISPAAAADIGWDGTTYYRGDIEEPASGSYSGSAPQLNRYAVPSPQFQYTADYQVVPQSAPRVTAPQRFYYTADYQYWSPETKPATKSSAKKVTRSQNR